MCHRILFRYRFVLNHLFSFFAYPLILCSPNLGLRRSWCPFINPISLCIILWVWLLLNDLYFHWYPLESNGYKKTTKSVVPKWKRYPNQQYPLTFNIWEISAFFQEIDGVAKIHPQSTTHCYFNNFSIFRNVALKESHFNSFSVNPAAARNPLNCPASSLIMTF